VIITEFLAHPLAGGNEWIELYNSTTTVADLTGWALDDSEGGSTPYSLPSNTTIDPSGYLSINLPSAMLNNDGDSFP
jgi:hypothetical protein